MIERVGHFGLSEQIGRQRSLDVGRFIPYCCQGCQGCQGKTEKQLSQICDFMSLENHLSNRIATGALIV